MPSPCELALLTGAPPYDPPPTSGPGAPTTQPGGGLFSLTNWKLTLPIGSKGKPTEIFQPALATFRDSRFFYVNDSGDGIVFRCPGKGTTTTNSKNPRSELREMTHNGKKEASWRTNSGTHEMVITQKIHDAPHAVVAGQVHDSADDVCVFRLEDDHLWATDGDDPHGDLITGSYVFGTQFEAKFISSGGEVRMYYNGSLVATRSGNRSGCYFKAGAYHQSNGSGAAAAVVEILGLTVTHS